MDGATLHGGLYSTVAALCSEEHPSQPLRPSTPAPLSSKMHRVRPCGPVRLTRARHAGNAHKVRDKTDIGVSVSK